MNYNDLLQHYFERSNALQNYWTLYVVVIGGLFTSTLLTLVLLPTLYAWLEGRAEGSRRINVEKKA